MNRVRTVGLMQSGPYTGQQYEVPPAHSTGFPGWIVVRLWDGWQGAERDVRLEHLERE